MKLLDKNGKEIKQYDIIYNKNNGYELVYPCLNQYLELELGINASNIDYLKTHPNAVREFYLLSQFDTENEWEVVGNKEHNLDLLDKDHQDLALDKFEN